MLVAIFMGCSAPSLELVRPEGTVAGPVRIDIDSSASVHVSIDGEPLENALDGSTLTIDTSDWTDGDHTIEVRAGNWPFPTTVEAFTLTTDNTPPGLAWSTRGTSVEQGHTLPVVFRLDEPAASLTVHALGRERTASKLTDDVWRALVGVPIREEAGPTEVVVTVTDALGNRGTHRRTVEIQAVEWPFSGRLPLSKRAAKVTKPGIEAMRRDRDAVYAHFDSAALWSGLMDEPVRDGRHTSAFGTYREYPDGRRSHHDAEDIALRKKTPIYAAADGRVALAKRQEVHGNAVLLSHGQKIVTLYSHMHDLAVEEGQRVEKGDLIGRMGSTGRSTGPHLHWGIVVDEVPCDPMQWTVERFDAGAFDTFEPAP